MTALMSFVQERVLLLDGGMGTQILSRRPTVDDFGGAAQEGCMEILNERRPQWIREIHAAYFEAGADAVETNSFGCNEVMLQEYGLAHRTEELNFIAARLARECAADFPQPRYVIGSVGPGSKLLSLGHVNYDTLLRSYRTQILGLLKGGVDAVLIETCQDLGQMKVAIRAAKEAMAALKIQRPLWLQATVETSGTLLLGTELQAVITVAEMLGVDALGLNCGTGPDEMHAPLSLLAESSPFAISCLPNAGLPVSQDGTLVYPLEPETFADKVAALAREFQLNILGGCCGTTPAHIQALKARIGKLTVTHRVPTLGRSVASLYQSVALCQEPRPLIVGERTNASGSKAFREALKADSLDTQVAIAKDQERQGAHMLDVCVAFVGRDEGADMEAFLRKAVLQTTLPIMVDSTDPLVVERALKAIPGKAVVNSIHFEEGESKARRVLDLCRTHGAAVVGLCIDEEGMARSADRKLAVASRLHNLVVREYCFDEADLILDPLTFTLASGDQESRGSAVETLKALRLLKERYSRVLTVLGLSNVSFGLKASARHVLNTVMLREALKEGLDLAIFNAARLRPMDRIPEAQRLAAEDLIHNRRGGGADPLKAYLALFEQEEGSVGKKDLDTLSATERLRLDILRGERVRVALDVERVLRERAAQDVLKGILLPAMKEVGDRFGAGELQLPFVLESAEAMKAAVQVLEPKLPRGESGSKGRVVLATVKGDVHDIGKNLVNIVFSNNGFDVEDLGIKQPVERMLAALEEKPALALGMSGLLVKSVQIMRENLIQMAEAGLRIPVILGGAALTRDYVESECGPVYPGPVLYAEDAFEGLRHMERILAGEAINGIEQRPGTPAITVLHRGEKGLELDDLGRSPWVRRQDAIPVTPFLGVRDFEPSVEDLFRLLDDFVVIRNRWSFTQGKLSDEDFAAVLGSKAEPLLSEWKRKLREKPILRPRAKYGYFLCASSGDRLRIFDEHGNKVLTELVFPRQEGGRRLCIADFFEPRRPEGKDVVALQAVSLGQGAADHAAELHAAGRYADYFTFHGLATELTEAFAELVHARIRRELGLHGHDATQKRQLLNQGYQGSRYSFGYPACPDLEGNAEVMALLEAETIGLTLTGSFQMVPEYATTALVAWHPQARYFAV